MRFRYVLAVLLIVLVAAVECTGGVRYRANGPYPSAHTCRSEHVFQPGEQHSSHKHDHG